VDKVDSLEKKKRAGSLVNAVPTPIISPASSKEKELTPPKDAKGLTPPKSEKGDSAKESANKKKQQTPVRYCNQPFDLIFPRKSCERRNRF
jgi:hypothetical protein